MMDSRRTFLKRATAAAGIAALMNLTIVNKLFSAEKAEKKMLIAYFSHTGNTELAAKEIQKLTNADIHRIRPVEIYPQEHDPCSKIAGQQLRSNYRPKLAAHVDNMGEYSVIFLGYPIWWHTMPMVCWTFLENYDFSGKTIIPFCTSGGDTLKRSIRDIKSLCPRAMLLDGYETWNAYSPTMPQEVEEWLRRIQII